jgi:hypothetical protein
MNFSVPDSGVDGPGLDRRLEGKPADRALGECGPAPDLGRGRLPQHAKPLLADAPPGPAVPPAVDPWPFRPDLVCEARHGRGEQSGRRALAARGRIYPGS